MFYFTQPLPASFASQSIRSVLFSHHRWKSSKMGSPWLWPLWVWHGSSNGLKFSAFETVWIFTLTAIFKPLQSFSKFPFFQICLNFPMSKLQKTRPIFSPPLRMVGTVLTSWSWLSPLSSCSRKVSAVFPCLDHSVYSGPLQDNGDNDGSNSNEFKWWWLNH